MSTMWLMLSSFSWSSDRARVLFFLIPAVGCIWSSNTTSTTHIMCIWMNDRLYPLHSTQCRMIFAYSTDIPFHFIRLVPFHSIPFHSILFYSILFYSILFYSVLFCSVLFCSALLLSFFVMFAIFCFTSTYFTSITDGTTTATATISVTTTSNNKQRNKQMTALNEEHGTMKPFRLWIWIQ